MSEIKSINQLFDSAEEPVLSDTDESTVGEPIDNTVNTEQTPQPTEQKQVQTRSIDDLTGGVADFITDTVDNVIGGNQFTRQEITENRQKGKEIAQQKKNPVVEAIKEPFKALGGAYTGMAEEGLEAAEWAGDVVKTGISKGLQKVGVDLYSL